MNSAMNFGRSRLLWLAIVLALGPMSSHADCTQISASIERLQRMVGAENTARDALVTVRRNAQDWKNLLLRGRDASDRQSLQIRFETQADAYGLRLSQLRVQMTQLGLGLDHLVLLEREQIRLFDRYRAALARHGVGSLEAAAAADREVQGADVVTFRTLEQVIEVLSAKNLEQFHQVKQGVSTCQASTTSTHKQ